MGIDDDDDDCIWLTPPPPSHPPSLPLPLFFLFNFIVSFLIWFNFSTMMHVNKSHPRVYRFTVSSIFSSSRYYYSTVRKLININTNDKYATIKTTTTATAFPYVLRLPPWRSRFRVAYRSSVNVVIVVSTHFSPPPSRLLLILIIFNLFFSLL